MAPTAVAHTRSSLAIRDPIFGNNIHFCKGRCLTGPNSRSAILAFVMILAPSILFHWTFSPWFLESSRPLDHSATFLVPLIAILLQVLAFVFFFLTALSDPGILPRQRDAKNSYDALTQQFRSDPPPKFQDAVINGFVVRLKYCITCHVYRPPRCVHCSICDNCVERFDHHCPWVGNCIGKRNYRNFYSFVVCVSLLSIYVLSVGLIKLSIAVKDIQKEEPNGWKIFLRVWKDIPDVPILVVFTAAASTFVVGLCGYHTYLVVLNQTTYEQLKNFYHDSHNPFYRGPVGNCQQVLCSPVRAVYFNPKTSVVQSLYEPRYAEEVDPNARRHVTALQRSIGSSSMGVNSPVMRSPGDSTSSLYIDAGVTGGADGLPSIPPVAGGTGWIGMSRMIGPLSGMSNPTPVVTFDGVGTPPVGITDEDIDIGIRTPSSASSVARLDGSPPPSPPGSVGEPTYPVAREEEAAQRSSEEDLDSRILLTSPVAWENATAEGDSVDLHHEGSPVALSASRSPRQAPAPSPRPSDSDPFDGSLPAHAVDVPPVPVTPDDPVPSSPAQATEPRQLILGQPRVGPRLSGDLSTSTTDHSNVRSDSGQFFVPQEVGNIGLCGYLC